MSWGVSPGLCCEAFDGVSGVAWIVVTVFSVPPRPPAAAITATTKPPPSRAETNGMVNVRFICRQDDRPR